MKECLVAGLVLCSASYGASDGCEHCAKARAAYAGCYVGAGISYQNNFNDVTMDDNLANVGGILIVDAHRETLLNKNKGKIGGALNVGYGDFIDSNCYLGADLTLDISGNAKSSNTRGEAIANRGPLLYGTTEVRNRGVVPILAVRLGGYVPAMGTLAYAKVGMSVVKVTTRVCDDSQLFAADEKSTKVVPVIGFGLEKTICDNCSAKLEGDYRFESKERVSDFRNPLANLYRASMETKTRGYSIRLVGVYHF